MNWTEHQIAQALDGRFYQLQQKSLGSFTVVDLLEPDEEQQPEPTPVVEAPAVEPEVRRKADGGFWLEDIARVVCAVHGVTRLELISPRRSHYIVDARQVFFWLAKHFTSVSFVQIGVWCGDRDHTTVMHGIGKIDRQFARYSQNINKCLSRLGVSLNEREAA